MIKVNINIKSNVYPVSGDQPWKDMEFLSKVHDFRALGILDNNPVFKERLSNLQRDLLERGLCCSVHPKKHRPVGIIKGEKKPVCRCEIVSTCGYAERGKCR